MEYGQFCPIAKANEIIGDKWTLLIIREILMGGTRYSELQRGLSHISPSLLSKRLDSLAAHGLIVKKRIAGQKGYEYFPTASCEELQPIIFAMGEWGLRWAKSNLTEKDYDVELLMVYLQRSIVTEKLPGSTTTIRYKFSDADKLSDWWLVVKGSEIDLCLKDPGNEVDVYCNCTVKTMILIWTGEQTYRQAQRDGSLNIVGDSYLTGTISQWMTNSVFSELPSAELI